jgi:ParB-like chromosome segregation protein Spo0J
MRHHEYAALFPMLPDAELQSLANDIRDNGLETPIVTLEGAILDGRNRHRACEIAGVSPRFEEYTGKDPMQFVISHNLHRRHLDESQRGMIAARLANLRDGVRSDRQGSSIGLPTHTQSEAAALLNVGTSTVKRARAVLTKGEPELAEMVADGKLSVAAAEDVAKLSQDEQKQAIAGGAAGVKEAAKKSRSAKTKDSPLVRSSQQSTSTTQSSGKMAPYTPSDALAIWATAKSVLNRIHAKDTERKAALEAAKQYIETRLENDQ